MRGSLGKADGEHRIIRDEEDRPLRVALVGPIESVHLRRWASQLKEHGTEVCVVSDQLPPPDFDIEVHLVSLETPRCLVGVPKLRTLAWEVAVARRLHRMLASIRPDVVHAHYVLRYGFAAFLSRWRPYVISAWGSDVYLYNDEPRHSRMLTRRALARASRVLCDSEDLAAAAIALGADLRSTELVCFGVDLEVFSPGKDSEGSRRLLGIPHGAPVVFSPRLMREHYQIETIVKAFSMVPTTEQPPYLLLKDYQANPGYRAQVRQLVDELGLADRVRMVGECTDEEMAELYCLSSVVVSMAKTDGTPVSILEALACGRVVVASDVPSVREWIIDEENGFLAPVRPGTSPADLATILLRALEVDEQQARMWAATNIALVKSRANVRDSMAKAIDIYKSVNADKVSSSGDGLHASTS